MSELEFVNEIKAERLLLRRLRHQDAPEITKLISNWNVIQWLSNPPYPYQLSDAEAFIARVSSEQTTWNKVRLAIEIDGALAGMVGHEPNACGTLLGYWLGEPYWGKGYMTEAVGIFLKSYFEVADNNKIVSCVLRGNEASLRIQRAFGFETVGESELFCAPHGSLRPSISTHLSRENYEAKLR